MGRHHTKTDVVVEVVDVVLVAVRTTGIPLIIVEGTAAQHTGVESASPVARTRHMYYSPKNSLYAKRPEGFCASMFFEAKPSGRCLRT